MHCISINGIQAEYLPVDDRGLQYGDGLFETIACVDSKLQFWEQHLQRMATDAEKLGISFPGEQYFLSDINNLLESIQAKSCVIKLILTRGTGQRGYKYSDRQHPTRIVMVKDWPNYRVDSSTSGVRVCLCKHTISVNPALAGIKHLNRLDNVMARNEWATEFDEGLMADVSGNIIEGTMSNVFGIKDQTLFTPSLIKSGVNGIIREQVLEFANSNDFNLKITDLSIDDFNTMDEIFLTNSLIGIWPVHQLGELTYKANEISKMFNTEIQRRMSEHAKTLD